MSSPPKEAQRLSAWQISSRAMTVGTFVTVIATLILSLKFCASSKIEIRPEKRLFIDQRFGALALNQNILARNNGTLKGVVTNIKSYLWHQDSNGLNLINVFSASDIYTGRDQGKKPYIEYQIHPDEERLINTDFVTTFDQAFLDTTVDLENALINEADNRKNIEIQRNPTKTHYASPELTKKILGFIDRRIKKLSVGSYIYVIEFNKNYSVKPFVRNYYTFDLSPLHLRIMKETIKDFVRINLTIAPYTRPSIQVLLDDIQSSYLRAEIDQSLDSLDRLTKE